jgi:bacteriorhodopsin
MPFDPVMDIARPDLKENKTNKPHRIVWIGVAVILAVAVFLVVRFERSPQRRKYVTIKHDSRAFQALVLSS